MLLAHQTNKHSNFALAGIKHQKDLTDVSMVITYQPTYLQSFWFLEKVDRPFVHETLLWLTDIIIVTAEPECKNIPET